MVEGASRPDVMAEVVAIVCPVGEVERLCNQLDVSSLADLDVFGEATVKFTVTTTPRD
jgi:hypothetical protein